MRSRPYAVYDVFTSEPLGGNPLAVVFDSAGLDTGLMQRIAREFNISETVFVAAPENPAHTASIRIFTPGVELPFAGHPTVGTAIALAERTGSATAGILVLEEKVGPVRCAVSRDAAATFAEFDLPRRSQKLAFTAEPAAVAAALDLDPQDIGFENHRIGLWSAGVPYVTVPVSGLAAAGRAKANADLWLALLADTGGLVAAPYVYCRESIGHDCAFHARMFAPWDGIAEDPATGSALAALTGALLAYDQPRDGASLLWVEQGVEMGRPSRMRLEMEIAGGAATALRIGGNAIKVAEGTLFV